MSTEYLKILQDVDYPTDVIVLDFETYFDSEYSLAKMSTIEYITDKRFDLLGLAVKDVSASRSRFIAPKNVEETVKSIPYNEVTIVCHNFKVEAGILKFKYGIDIPYLIDTLDLSRHVEARDRHDLAHLAGKYDLSTPKGNALDNLKGVYWKDLGFTQKLALQNYAINDVQLEWELFCKLLPKLSNPQFEIPFMAHNRKLYLKPKFVIKKKKAKALIQAMDSEIEDKVKLTNLTRKGISGNKSFCATLQDALGNEPIPTKPGSVGPIPALAKDDPQAKELAAHKIEDVRNLMNARLAVKSWPLHIRRVERLLNQSQAIGGRLPIPLNYCGAHTSRPTGGEKINVLNFGSRGNKLMKMTKSLLEAPTNHKVVTYDSSQIEARWVAYMAGQEDLLNQFATGGDPYVDFASSIFHTKLRKASESDPKPVAKYLNDRRFLGKTGILGLGYGTGHAKFYNTILSSEVGLPMVQSGLVTKKFCWKAVQTYRRRYDKIIQLWDTIEDGVKLAIKENISVPLPKGIVASCKDGTLEIKYPSSRVMRYPKCRIELKRTDRGDAENIHWKYGTLWGGSLLENISQSICRDIIAGQLMELEKAGYDVAIWVYDSITIVVDKDQAETCSEDMQKIMRTPPKWASDLPLDCEGEISNEYK